MVDKASEARAAVILAGLGFTGEASPLPCRQEVMFAAARTSSGQPKSLAEAGACESR